MESQVFDVCEGLLVRKPAENASMANIIGWIWPWESGTRRPASSTLELTDDISYSQTGEDVFARKIKKLLQTKASECIKEMDEKQNKSM